MHRHFRIRKNPLSSQTLFAGWLGLPRQAAQLRSLPRLLLVAAALVALLTPPSFAAPQEVTGSGLIERYLGDTAATSMGADLTPAIKALKDGNSERALLQLKKIQESSARNKRLDRVLFLEALAYLQSGEKDKAIISLERSLALRGSNSDALVLYAELLSLPERRLDAITQAIWFNRFVVVSPAAALAEQAEILIQMGQPKRAQRAIASALTRSPDCISCRLVAAKLALTEGRKQEALSTLQQALATSPDDSKVKAALAQTLLAGAERGKDAALIAEAKRLAGELYSTGEDADLDTVYLYAKALIESEETGSARKVVTAAMSRHPNDENLLRLQQQIRLEETAAF